MGRATSSRSDRAPRWRLAGPGLLVFALALLLRVLFWQATSDSGWSYSACYKGDAPVWLAWAEAIQDSRPFEVGLPVRPPGAAWLIATLWNGRESGIILLKLAWCVLGALAAWLFYRAARRSFGPGPGLVTGLACAASTGLMQLSTSLNNETPYLVLVAATLWLQEEALGDPARRRGRALAAWSALHAAACLVRVEHALFFGMALAYGIFRVWRRAITAKRAPRDAWRPALRAAVLSLAVFALALLPWHLHAWSAVARFNHEPLPADPATEALHRRIESTLAHIRWEPAAEAELETMPGATRRLARMFVAGTVGVRGRTTVTASDLAVLEEAFGTRPEPLSAFPFVAVYGGLNFHLANNPKARGGFGRAPLEDPPPLAGGADRYPLALVRGLPPPQLTLTYPPHLREVNRGYRLGLAWIRDHPGDYLKLAATKLRFFWEGAALGLGGYNLPLGLSGVRRNVDLTVPETSPGVTAWRLALLAAALLGLWTGLRDPGHRGPLVPWALFLASKVIVTLAFFGYARQGATVIPVVALLVALAAESLWPGARRRTSADSASTGRRHLRAALIAAVLLVGIETARWLSDPDLLLDGREVGATDPFPPGDYADRRLEIR